MVSACNVKYKTSFNLAVIFSRETHKVWLTGDETFVFVKETCDKSVILTKTLYIQMTITKHRHKC